MSLLGNLTVGIIGNISGMSSSFGQAATEVQNFGKKAQNLGRSISGVGDNLTRKITVPAVAAASALTGITLVKGFQRLVGIDTAQAKLKGLGHDAESVEEIMTSALDAVRGTAFGMDEAATSAAGAVAAGIEPGKELTRYLTIAGDAAAIAGSSMSDMGSIFGKVQTAQKAYTGELNQLADRGIPIFQWLAEEAGVTAEKVREMASDGEISSEMFLEAIENNIGGAAKTMGEESFVAGIANIGAAIGRLGAEFLDAGEDGEGFFSTVKPLISEAIGYIDNLAETASNLGTKFGEAFNDMIEKVIEIKDWFVGLEEDTQQLILKIAAIGTAIAVGIGPALKIIGSLITMFGTASKFIGLLMGPLGITIAAIGALVAVGVLLYQNWDTIKAKAEEVFGHFAPLIEVVKASFQTLMDSLGPIWEALKNLFESLLPILEKVYVVVSAVLVTAFGILIGVFNGVVAAIGPIIEALINFVDFAVNMVNAIVALFTGDFAGAWQFLQDAGQSTIDFFINIFNGLLNFIGGFIDGVIGFFHGLYMALVGNSIIPDMVNGILDWFKNMFQWVIDVVRNIVNGVISFFTNLKNGIVNIFNAVRSFISSVLSGIRSIFTSIITGIVSFVVGRFTSLKNTVSNIFNSLRGIVSSAFGKVTGAVKTGISNAYSAVTGKVRDFFNAGRNIVTSIADGIKGAIGKVTGAIGNVTQKIRDFLPFSPAKDGALRDIMNVQIAESIADSIYGGSDTAVQAMRKLTDDLNDELVDPNFSQVNLSGKSSEVGGQGVFDLSEVVGYLKVIAEKSSDVYLGREKVGEVMSEEQARRTNMYGRKVAY